MKKILCFVLCMMLLLSSVTVAFASGEDTEAERELTPIERVETDSPVIVVRGMQFTDGLQFDRGTENAKPVNVQFDAGQLIKYLGKTLLAVLTSFSIEAGISVVCEYVTELFSAYPCDENGDSLHENISAAWYPEAVSNYPELYNKTSTDEVSIVASLWDRYGGDMVYYFVYDWRLDPQDNADLLASTVDKALSETGCEKADIICCSMGGSVAMAYMAEYGYDKLGTVISNTSVMFGADVITDLFQGKVCFDADAVDRYVNAMVPSIGGLISFMNKTGALDILCKLLNNFAQKHEKQIFEESLVPTFATLPGFWSMMKGESYPAAREFIFSGKEDKYAGLLSRLDGFYNNVSSRRQEITDGALANGVNLIVIASYNSPLVPAYESAKYHGDGMVETAPMSGGALTSVLGGVLTEEQLAVGDSRYVSPDKCINASTCIYPEYTWFLKSAGHVVGLYGSDAMYFLMALLESEAQPTISTFSQYPQFMASNADEDILSFE